jgi:hypothetical protein
MNDENCDKAFCRCCGRRIAISQEFRVTHDTNDLDGYCRWCELGHQARPEVDQLRLSV